MKFFTVKQFFAFLASFLVTFVVGFFLWNNFNNINASIFKGSVSEAPVLQQAEPVAENPAPETVLAEVVPAETPAPAPVVSSEEARQDIIDDIAEKLDIIQQQVNDLVAESKADAKPEEDKKDEVKKEDDKEKQDKLAHDKISYPKISIFRAQISPIEQRFISLYNPNNFSVDLTGWYLQRKTQTADSWSSAVSSTNFEGKIIQANSYFIIARQLAGADILMPDLTITENNLLALKNPNQEIVDSFETQSVSVTPSGGGGGGSISECSTTASKNILISEFQVEDKTVDDDYVELFNPNDQAICLGNWSIQKASSTGKISHIKNFNSDAKILSKNYFLIVNSKANQELLNLADMTSSGLELSSESAGGNTIYLVKKQGTIVDDKDPDISDEVGYGMAKNYVGLVALKPLAGKSTGRIWDEALGEYKNTLDNSSDFEIDVPTPKSENIKYVESETPPAPTLESVAITTPATKLEYLVGESLDITGLVVTGTYSDASTQAMTVTRDNVSGFDSSAPAEEQTLTITLNEKTTNYTIKITAPPETPPPVLLAITSYTFNGTAQNITVDPTINPVQIYLLASENVNWMSIYVENISDPSIRREFTSGAGCVDGTMSCSKKWDGKNKSSGGTMVPDGNYRIKVHIKDIANKEFNDYITPYIITVNTTLLQ